MNSVLSEARSLFASTPDEVVEGWLADRVASAGWPPEGDRWNALLAGYSPDEWATFSWRKAALDIYSLTFSQKSIRDIHGLSLARFANEQNAYANIENSAFRMQEIHKHIQKTRQLPGTLVLIDGTPSWDIVDCCHRIAMYIAWLRNNDLQNWIERKQTAWVAKPQNASAGADQIRSHPCTPQVKH